MGVWTNIDICLMNLNLKFGLATFDYSITRCFCLEKDS